MKRDLPKITANDGLDDGENQRGIRLACVRHYLLDVKGIRRLHDHKGNLTVWWDHLSTDWAQERVNRVWSDHCEDIVEHRLADGSIIGASPGHTPDSDIWPVDVD